MRLEVGEVDDLDVYIDMMSDGHALRERSSN